MATKDKMMVMMMMLIYTGFVEVNEIEIEIAKLNHFVMANGDDWNDDWNGACGHDYDYDCGCDCDCDDDVDCDCGSCCCPLGVGPEPPQSRWCVCVCVLDRYFVCTYLSKSDSVSVNLRVIEVPQSPNHVVFAFKLDNSHAITTRRPSIGKHHWPSFTSPILKVSVVMGMVMVHDMDDV